MPLYDYKCKECGKVTEVRHGFDESHTEACQACGGQLARVFSAAPIVFKGSGFYLTDSRTKSAPAEKAGEPAAASSEPKAGDSKPADAKPAAAKPAASGPSEPAA